MNSLKNPEWWNAALTRAVKTAAQVAVATFGVNATGFTSVDWLGLISLSLTSAFFSVLTSIAGLPEVQAETTEGE